MLCHVLRWYGWIVRIVTFYYWLRLRVKLLNILYNFPTISYCIIEWQIIRLGSSMAFDHKIPDVPKYAPFVAAGFFFGPASFLKEVWNTFDILQYIYVLFEVFWSCCSSFFEYRSISILRCFTFNILFFLNRYHLTLFCLGFSWARRLVWVRGKQNDVCVLLLVLSNYWTIQLPVHVWFPHFYFLPTQLMDATIYSTCLSVFWNSFLLYLFVGCGLVATTFSVPAWTCWTTTTLEGTTRSSGRVSIGALFVTLWLRCSFV